MPRSIADRIATNQANIGNPLSPCYPTGRGGALAGGVGLPRGRPPVTSPQACVRLGLHPFPFWLTDAGSLAVYTVQGISIRERGMAQHDTGYKLLFAHKEMVRDLGPDSLRLDLVEFVVT